MLDSDDPQPSPQLHLSPDSQEKVPENKYFSILRDHTYTDNRQTIITDSPDFDLLCQAIKKQVIDPFLNNRNKIYLEKCCWSFSKSRDSHTKKIPHQSRLCLNSHFPPKITDEAIIPAIKCLLLSVGAEIGKLKEGVLEVPFVNLPHLLAVPMENSQKVHAIQEQVEELKKRDIELFERANPLIESINDCKRSLKRVKSAISRHGKNLDKVHNCVLNLIKGVNEKFDTIYTRMNSLEKINKNLTSRMTDLEAEHKELKEASLPTRPPHQ